MECAECGSPLLDIKFSPALRCKVALCGLCASVPATNLKVSVAYAPTDGVESSAAESEELLRALIRDLQQRLTDERSENASSAIQEARLRAERDRLKSAVTGVLQNADLVRELVGGSDSE